MAQNNWKAHITLKNSAVNLHFLLLKLRKHISCLTHFSKQTGIPCLTGLSWCKQCFSNQILWISLVSTWQEILALLSAMFHECSCAFLCLWCVVFLFFVFSQVKGCPYCGTKQKRWCTRWQVTRCTQNDPDGHSGDCVARKTKQKFIKKRMNHSSASAACKHPSENDRACFFFVFVFPHKAILRYHKTHTM